MIKKILSWFKKNKQKKEDLVRFLVNSVSDLALDKDEIRLLPPSKGMWGCIAVMGNCLPVFVYSVFSETHQDFISVRVEASLPRRIQFRSFVQVKGHEGETIPNMYREVEHEEAWEAPFYQFSKTIQNYFPLVGTNRDNIPHILKSKIKPLKQYMLEDESEQEAG